MRARAAAALVAGLCLPAACELVVHDRQALPGTTATISTGTGAGGNAANGTGGAACRMGSACAGCSDYPSCVRCELAAAPASAPLYDPVVQCLCDVCYTACAGIVAHHLCGGPPSKPGACDQGTTSIDACTTCTSCETDAGICQGVTGTCSSDPTCLALQSAIAHDCQQPMF
jgi:hypothetical protein